MHESNAESKHRVTCMQAKEPSALSQRAPLPPPVQPVASFAGGSSMRNNTPLASPMPPQDSFNSPAKGSELSSDLGSPSAARANGVSSSSNFDAVHQQRHLAGSYEQQQGSRGSSLRQQPVDSETQPFEAAADTTPSSKSKLAAAIAAGSPSTPVVAASSGGSRAKPRQDSSPEEESPPLFRRASDLSDLSGPDDEFQKYGNGDTESEGEAEGWPESGADDGAAGREQEEREEELRRDAAAHAVSAQYGGAVASGGTGMPLALAAATAFAARKNYEQSGGQQQQGGGAQQQLQGAAAAPPPLVPEHPQWGMGSAAPAAPSPIKVPVASLRTEDLPPFRGKEAVAQRAAEVGGPEAVDGSAASSDVDDIGGTTQGHRSKADEEGQRRRQNEDEEKVRAMLLCAFPSEPGRIFLSSLAIAASQYGVFVVRPRTGAVRQRGRREEPRCPLLLSFASRSGCEEDPPTH